MLHRRPGTRNLVDTRVQGGGTDQFRTQLLLNRQYSVLTDMEDADRDVPEGYLSAVSLI